MNTIDACTGPVDDRRRFDRVVDVRSVAGRSTAQLTAWKETVATLGAWSPAVAYRPVIEQRLWRAGGRGALRHTLAVVLHDPFEQLDAAAADAEITELLRPIATRRVLPPLSALALRHYRSPIINHLAEPVGGRPAPARG